MSPPYAWENSEGSERLSRPQRSVSTHRRRPSVLTLTSSWPTYEAAWERRARLGRNGNGEEPEMVRRLRYFLEDMQQFVK